MVNLLNEGRLISFLRKFSRTQRILSSLFSIFFVSCIWMFLLYLPNKNYIEAQSLLHQKLLLEQNNLKINLSLLIDQEQKSKNLSIEFQDVLQDLKKNQNLDLILNSLKKNNLTCTALEPKDTKDKNFYNKKYLSLNAKGSFKDVVLFLKETEENIPGIKFKSVELERKKNNRVIFKSKLRTIDFDKIDL